MRLAPLFGLPLALLPAQILWINLITHGLPGLAQGVEQAEPDTMGRPPRRPGESLFVRGLWQHVLAMGLVTGAVSLGLGLWGQATGRPWQTMIFTSLALLQLGNALAVRSECQSVFGWALQQPVPGLDGPGHPAGPARPPLLAPTQTALDLQPLSLADLAIVLVASTAAFWASKPKTSSEGCGLPRGPHVEGQSLRLPFEADHVVVVVGEPSMGRINASPGGPEVRRL
jgi:Ca2+-transporting ATPase